MKRYEVLLMVIVIQLFAVIWLSLPQGPMFVHIVDVTASEAFDEAFEAEQLISQSQSRGFSVLDIETVEPGTVRIYFLHPDEFATVR